jgi:hypothetical protein
VDTCPAGREGGGCQQQWTSCPVQKTGRGGPLGAARTQAAGWPAAAPRQQVSQLRTCITYSVLMLRLGSIRNVLIVEVALLRCMRIVHEEFVGPPARGMGCGSDCRPLSPARPDRDSGCIPANVWVCPATQKARSRGIWFGAEVRTHTAVKRQDSKRSCTTMLQAWLSAPRKLRSSCRDHSSPGSERSTRPAKGSHVIDSATP